MQIQSKALNFSMVQKFNSFNVVNEIIFKIMNIRITIIIISIN